MNEPLALRFTLNLATKSMYYYMVEVVVFIPLNGKKVFSMWYCFLEYRNSDSTAHLLVEYSLFSLLCYLLITAQSPYRLLENIAGLSLFLQNSTFVPSSCNYSP